MKDILFGKLIIKHYFQILFLPMAVSNSGPDIQMKELSAGQINMLDPFRSAFKLINLLLNLSYIEMTPYAKQQLTYLILRRTMTKVLYSQLPGKTFMLL